MADDCAGNEKVEEIETIAILSQDTDDSFPDGGLKAWIVLCGVRKFTVCV
jgi:hypothetical protein